MTPPLPAISIIICTHDPDIRILEEALQAIQGQTGDHTSETILVDNRSALAFAAGMERLVSGTGVRLVQESRLGLSYARCCGISAARAPLLCFVDDDNILAPEYCETALRIARQEPELGIFGGRSLARTRVQPGALCRHFLSRYAVRDNPDPVTISGPERQLRGLEPFGAGMVVRADVARSFLALVDTFETGLPMGRNGSLLGSGEDSLFTRAAFRMGLKAGYRPELSLEHVIADERLRWAYLKRLIEGQARGEAVLDHLDAQWPDVPGLSKGKAGRLVRFLRRAATTGLPEAIGMTAWERGYLTNREESAALASRLSATLDEVVAHAPQRT